MPRGLFGVALRDSPQYLFAVALLHPSLNELSHLFSQWVLNVKIGLALGTEQGNIFIGLLLLYSCIHMPILSPIQGEIPYYLSL